MSFFFGLQRPISSFHPPSPLERLSDPLEAKMSVNRVSFMEAQGLKFKNLALYTERETSVLKIGFQIKRFDAKVESGNGMK